LAGYDPSMPTGGFMDGQNYQDQYSPYNMLRPPQQPIQGPNMGRIIDPNQPVSPPQTLGAPGTSASYNNDPTRYQKTNPIQGVGGYTAEQLINAKGPNMGRII
jgi:hypothetical protein